MDSMNDGSSHSLIVGHELEWFLINPSTREVTLANIDASDGPNNQAYVLEIEAGEEAAHSAAQLSVYLQVIEDELEAAVSSLNGRLSFGTQSALARLPLSEDFDHFVLRGTPSSVSTTLSELLFTPNHPYNGAAKLTKIKDDVSHSSKAASLLALQSFAMAIIPTQGASIRKKHPSDERAVQHSVTFATDLRSLEPLTKAGGELPHYKLTLTIDHASFALREGHSPDLAIEEVPGLVDYTGSLSDIERLLDALEIVPETGMSGDQTLTLHLTDVHTKGATDALTAAAQLHLKLPQCSPEPPSDTTLERSLRPSSLVDNNPGQEKPLADRTPKMMTQALSALAHKAEVYARGGWSEGALRPFGLEESQHFKPPIQVFVVSDCDKRRKETNAVLLSDTQGLGICLGSMFWVMTGVSIVSGLLISYPAWRAMEAVSAIREREETLEEDQEALEETPAEIAP